MQLGIAPSVESKLYVLQQHLREHVKMTPELLCPQGPIFAGPTFYARRMTAEVITDLRSQCLDSN